MKIKIVIHFVIIMCIRLKTNNLFYKKNHFKKVINILYFFKIVLVFLLLIPSPNLLAISPADLISNTDHTRLTVNPASLGGINEGIFQSQLSPCRPLVSLENGLTGGFSDQEKELKLEGGAKFLEFGSCLPIRGDFESNKGRINFNYEAGEENDVEYAAWSSTGQSLGDYRSNKGSENGQTLIRYRKQDFITDSLQIAYGWRHFGLGLRAQTIAEWQLGGTFFPEVTSIIGDMMQGRISEWREENIVGLGIGAFFGLGLLGPVQIGYRANKHYYRHEYHFTENGRIVDYLGIQGKGIATSLESGILLPKVFKIFSLAASNYNFPPRPTDAPENKMNFTGGTVTSIRFKPDSYTILGTGMNLDTAWGGVGFNLEDSFETGGEDFSKSIRSLRVSIPVAELHYGEQKTSYTETKIREATVEISVPYISIGYKQYEIFVKQNTGGDWQTAGKIAYPMITLVAYFGPSGIFTPPPRESKIPQGTSASISSLEAAAMRKAK